MPDPVPFFSAFHSVEEGWIDFNGHMNMGYYTVLLDRCADEAFAEMGFGPEYVAARNHTTFTAEFHVRYLRELKLGDRVRSSFHLLDHDAKRFHSFQELYHEDGWLAATGEGMTLHVDLSGPRVVAMPADVLSRVRSMAAAHARLPRPEGVGSRIGIRRA
ncbi:(3S)-malyl-CoA thioesterase [Roseovarius azorensis]|uniref:(3S)-malyl-CoA thioesterase n=1 Tax=Roseovarius azorensis TaxID=1287727 RepID=A0A1H7NPJ6_9RHOB|nr:thioesterase family protein [Roseovarius azorensis]SEL24945.1 (3S)-malyl-CoA thioesterase [Roseovarius azorensis]